MDWCLFFACICGFLVSSRCDPDCLKGGSRITDISLGYLNNPPKGSSLRGCLWTIRVPEGQVLELNFTYLNLPANQLCVFAYLEVWSADEVQRFCGSQAPPAMYFEGQNLVYVDYYSSRTIEQGEFKLQYKQVNVARTCSKDEVSCQNSLCVSRSLSCDGKDDCGDGTDEEGCGHKMVTPESCGVPAVSPELGNGGYIVGGREAVSGSWPWQVSLQKKTTHPSGHFCGGSLINNLWVITAAHCFMRRTASVVRVRLGDHNTFLPEDGEQTRYADKVILHPNYNSDLDLNDIALLKLKAPVVFSKTVSPICLPKTGEDLNTGDFLHVTGWGETFVDGTATNLQQVMLPLIDWNRCNRSYGGTVAPNTLCTNYLEGGHAPCNGDSGGPMTAQSENNLWTLYGLVSWGHRMCGHALGPSVFTKVSAFIPWIQSVMADH